MNPVTLSEATGFSFFILSICLLRLQQKRRQKTVKAEIKKKLDENDSKIESNISAPTISRKKNYVSLYEVISKIEKRVQLDEGKRGISDILLPEGEMFHAAVDIFHSNVVAILTGFPCLLDYDPPTETDGPLGCLAIAKTLLLLGKKVIILTDECNEEVLLACAAASNLTEYGATAENFIMQSFPAVFNEKDDLRFGEIYSSIDCLISIERSGPNYAQKYLTMRKRDMTSIVAPLEYLSLRDSPDGSSLLLRQDIKSIGIGDGGNEIGMGKVYDKVTASKVIPNAKEIACIVSANHLIIASVSNWGGYALCAAIALLTLKQQSLQNVVAERNQKQEKGETFDSVGSTAATAINTTSAGTSSSTSVISHNVEEYKVLMLRKDLVNEVITRFLPTNIEEINKCSRIVGAGARDGMTAKLEMMVDGMEIEKSLELLDEFRNIV
jgi:hypothetical protein